MSEFGGVTPQASSRAEGMPSMELEHSIGYSGRLPRSLYYHPNGVSRLRRCVGAECCGAGFQKDAVYVSGGCIVICDLSDPHNQIFLRGHDAPITCLDMSSSVRMPIILRCHLATLQGRYLCSGQSGVNADVIVWDFNSKTLLYRQLPAP